jgi:EAL domain-containing protein (putative c-di-GMP-specific phosphodiesterase class I)
MSQPQMYHSTEDVMTALPFADLALRQDLAQNPKRPASARWSAAWVRHLPWAGRRTAGRVARGGGAGSEATATPAASAVPGPARRACAFVFIANLPHLSEAYGLDFALGVSREIKRRLSAGFMRSAETDLACLRDDCFLLWSSEAFAGSAASAGLGAPTSAAAAGSSEAIEKLLAALAGEPVRVKGMVALPQIHADWIDVCGPEQLGASDIELALWAAQPFPDFQESRADGWRQRYRADMDVAVRVAEALQAGRLALHWQPVVDAYASATTFYSAAQARIAPDRDQPHPLVPSVFMPSLERLGLARLLDRAVACSVIEALRLQPAAQLGLSISAHSVRRDHWWASLLAALQANPDLASRLVVEVSNGASIQDMESARDFCVRLQQCGCRVAIEDFGAGALGVAAVQACRPDILKLDASFLRRARDSEFGHACLQDMLALCVHLASHTVVNGVEREDDLHIALRAGAQWLQGSYLNGARAPVPSSRADATSFLPHAAFAPQFAAGSPAVTVQPQHAGEGGQ